MSSKSQLKKIINNINKQSGTTYAACLLHMGPFQISKLKTTPQQKNKWTDTKEEMWRAKKHEKSLQKAN